MISPTAMSPFWLGGQFPFSMILPAHELEGVEGLEAQIETFIFIDIMIIDVSRTKEKKDRALTL